MRLYTYQGKIFIKQYHLGIWIDLEYKEIVLGILKRYIVFNWANTENKYYDSNRLD